MATSSAPFRQSFDILNSVLSFVFAVYFFDLTLARLIYLQYDLIFLVAIFLAKSFVLSGIYPSLVELASNERALLSFPDFLNNARKYFFPYLFTLVFFVFLHFLCVQFLPSFLNISADKSMRPFLMIFLGSVSFLLVWDKYMRPLRLDKRKTIITAKEIKVLAAAYFMDIFVCHIPDFVYIKAFDVERLSMIASTYIQLLMFIYLSKIIVDNHPEIKSKLSSEKELIMINPAGGGVFFSLATTLLRLYPPVFVVLKALTPQEYAVKTFNRIPWRRRYFESNAQKTLVAVTCYTSNAYEAYHIAQVFRQRGCKVILGGPHVMYLPEEALYYGDSVVIGEAEGVWQQIIEDFEKGELKPRYMGSVTEKHHELVHQELMRSPPAVVKDFLETQRGCKFRCHFCTIPGLSQGKVRRKPIEEVVELIKKIRPKYKIIRFIDNDIYSDPAYAKDLFKALLPLGVSWHTQCTIDIAKNEETLRLAKESGCDFMLIGYEIFGGSQEESQGGKFAMAGKYKEYTRKIKDLGIGIKAHFIFGFDADTFRSMASMWKFCLNIKPMWTIMSVLTPLPGSKVYYDYIGLDRISNLNWRKYNCQHLVFDHPRMNNALLRATYPLYVVWMLCTTSLGGFFIFLVFLASCFI